MTKVILNNEDKYAALQNDDAKNLSDHADFVTIINRVYELQGKKVNHEVCDTIANRLLKDGFELEQLENAEKIMAGHRFIQLGYPEFLQYLPSRKAKDEICFCEMCGEQFEEGGKFFAKGMLVSLCVKRDAEIGLTVSETRILCKCDKGRKSQKIWAAMPIFAGKKCFKAGGKWYFVFPMNDEFWFDRKWKIKEYINEILKPTLDLNSEETKEKFESFFERSEKDLRELQSQEEPFKKINLISTFQKIVDDTLTD
jgi:hypothetical protein